MHILFLGGVFDPSREKEIMKKTRTQVEHAANNFQLKIIKGLKLTGNSVRVVSAPFVGAWPNAYDDIYFSGFQNAEEDQSGFEYIHFLNIWGLRNPSRARALKEQIKGFLESPDPNKIIIIYTPHTPLLRAANHLKRLDGTIRTCLIVPDLPQYMNLADRVPRMYTFLKKYDIKAFEKECKQIDTFVLLTEPMKDVLKVGDKKYAVIEGIYDGTLTSVESERNSDEKHIVYTGKLDRKFGVLNLVHAFMNMHDPRLRLVICGSGETAEEIRQCAGVDSRIAFKGQVTSSQAQKYIQAAAVLVNPRGNDSDYTKYSFPSKTIEYLATGNPVVAYLLDGMPDSYKNFIFAIGGSQTDDIKAAIERALGAPAEEKQKRASSALRYLAAERSPLKVAQTIITLCED